jgi:hypothetical protein
MYRKAAWSCLAAGAAIVTSYLAWCQTQEGKLCGSLVRTELNHYSERTK